MELEAIRAGGKRALADALAGIEAAPEEGSTADLLDAAFAAPKGVALGLTGPPGVGKSTLIDALLRAWRSLGKTVGVIAVDPSSQRSGGAFLGDRTRFSTDAADAGVFVRSMAARDRLGGLAELTYPAMVLMRALFDLVIVETVGVGQSETEIAAAVDLVAYCAQPGSGDALQYMKAGIMEVPDIVVVTKCDMGAVARRTVSDLKGALSLASSGQTPPVLGVAAVAGSGISEFLQEICTLVEARDATFATSRRMQLESWAQRQITSRFGSEGLKQALNFTSNDADQHTFNGIMRSKTRLSNALSAAFQ